jgi:hypothetical protein
VAHAARFAGGRTTGSCSAIRSTFFAVHRITQSVCMTLVYRAMYSISEIPSYDKPAAERHWERLIALYRRCLE